MLSSLSDDLIFALFLRLLFNFTFIQIFAEITFASRFRIVEGNSSNLCPFRILPVGEKTFFKEKTKKEIKKILGQD